MKTKLSKKETKFILKKIGHMPIDDAFKMLRILGWTITLVDKK